MKYIYVVIYRQIVSLFHHSSVWLDPRDTSSRDRNPGDFTSVRYLTPEPIVFLSVSEGIFYISFLHKLYRLPEGSIHEKSNCILAYVVAGKFPTWKNENYKSIEFKCFIQHNIIQLCENIINTIFSTFNGVLVLYVQNREMQNYNSNF